MTHLNKAAIAAGQRQESEVAFYLERALSAYDKVDVFHNVQLTHNGQNAQIDHLILHPSGIVIIESKSVTGEVSVNVCGEWSRSYRGNWKGMPSPIIQAQNQLALLRCALTEQFKADDSLKAKASRWLNDRKPVAECPCKTLVAVSSNAIIHREGMPESISDQVVKTEFIGVTVEKMAKPRTGLAKAKNYFLREQREELKQFFEAHTQPQPQPQPTNQAAAATPTAPTAPTAPKEPTSVPVTPKPSADARSEPKANKETLGTASLEPQKWALCCKDCGATETLAPKWGKYGYYVVCDKCNKNTPMKAPCPNCKGKGTKVSKRKTTYTLSCPDCAFTGVFES